jgi:hypothetical protein
MASINSMEDDMDYALAPLTEPMPVPDIFCSGMAAVEDIGDSCVRLHFYANQTGTVLGDPERVTVVKLVMPRSAFLSAIALTERDTSAKAYPLAS